LVRSKNEMALRTKSQKQRKYLVRELRATGVATGIVSPGAPVTGEPSKSGLGDLTGTSAAKV
jgi:hypothetical protein